MTDEEQHWCQSSKDTQPFFLARMISANDPQAPPFHVTVSFPWREDSLRTLWEGRLLDESNPESTQYQSDWAKTVNEWEGTTLVGSNGGVYVFPRYATKNPIFVRLCDKRGGPQPDLQVRCVAWGCHLNPPTEPVAIVAAKNLIYIIDLGNRRLIGCIRGHGGDITSIAVNHIYPYLFCTSSKDMSTRLHDLSYLARQKPNNPPWPPSKKPSLAGPAFGLQMTESEGKGIGRCTAVFVGGRSGGHDGAVFHVAFHPTTLLIATCGMDRAVKIWRVPPSDEDKLARIDKPLFSTDLIHKSRVLSISWLSDDILISYCAPAHMRMPDTRELYEEPGTIVVWRWLGWPRFFPPDRPHQRIMRGCIEDYRRSESFHILSSYSLPMITRQIHICAPFVSADTGSRPHDPLVLVPMEKTIRILNITDFQPRKPPQFPLGDEIVEQARRLNITTPEAEENGDERGGPSDEAEATDPPLTVAPIEVTPEELLQSVDGWDVSAVRGNSVTQDTLPDIENCEMAFDGRVIFGVGKKRTLYMWKLGQEGGKNA